MIINFLVNNAAHWCQECTEPPVKLVKEWKKCLKTFHNS